MSETRMTREQYETLMEAEGSGQVAAYANRDLPIESTDYLKARIRDLERQLSTAQALIGQYGNDLRALAEDRDYWKDRATAQPPKPADGGSDE